MADWNGVTRSASLKPAFAADRRAFIEACAMGDWLRAMRSLETRHDLANAWALDEDALDAPLHHVARIGAPAAVARAFIRHGAWRTLRNARMERPFDLAMRLGRPELVDALTPRLAHAVPQNVVDCLEARLHDVIRGRVARLVDEHALRLPSLSPLLEVGVDRFWFAVPGMHGGFRVSFATFGAQARLVSESWCRVVESSDERHEITTSGAEWHLVDTGPEFEVVPADKR